MALQCIGWNHSHSVTHSTTAENDDESANHEVAQDFYKDDNYQLMLQCLDKGYNDLMTMIEYMEDRLRLLRAYRRSLNSYSKKWRQKLQHQAPLSSYNTTKRAQFQTVGLSTELTPHIDVLCTAIEPVISDCRIRVGKLYKRKSKGPGHEHRQTAAIRKVFKAARAPVQEVSKELDRLNEKKNRASAVVNQAATQVEQLENGPTSNKSKLKRAKEQLADKQTALQNIKKRIARAKSDLQEQQVLYREEATKIFRKYQKHERERLDLIRDTLIKFIQAMHSSQYSDNINRVYDDLLAKIENEQSTEKDLHFWERIYGVDDEPEADHDEDEDEEDETTVPQSNTKTPAEEPETTTSSSPEGEPV